MIPAFLFLSKDVDKLLLFWYTDFNHLIHVKNSGGWEYEAANL